jgi:hypothetical protein
MIVDGLAFLLVSISLAAVVVGYERNLPDPAAPPSRVAESAPIWADPDTTGSIAPAASGEASRWVDAQFRLPPAGADRADRAAGGSWVNPPRR